MNKDTQLLTIAGPAIPQKTVTLPLQASARADLARQSAALELSTKFDESHIQAKLGATRFEPLAATFDVAIDRLDLDRYLPAPVAGRPAAGKAAPVTPETTMAAMAQLDCGQCGYLCQTYAESVWSGAEADLGRCVPGGKETQRKLKELLAALEPERGGVAPSTPRSEEHTSELQSH